MWQTSVVCCHCTWLAQQSEPSHLPKSTLPPSKCILFHKCRCKAMHLSKHWTFKSFKGVLFHRAFLRCVMKQHRNQFSLGLFQEFSASCALVFLLFCFHSFFFHQNLKLPLKMQVTVSGRQFHRSTPVWSIGQIMAMTVFFKLQWWEWHETHDLLLQWKRFKWIYLNSNFQS